MTFELIEQSRMGRRTMLTAPLAFVGFLTLLRKSERPLPHASQQGNGPEIPIVVFSADGRKNSVVNVRKIVKSDDAWKRELSPEEYAVTRRKATEFAFANLYWKTHREGLYRCVCCGNALFGWRQKFNSGTGWPSFWAPLAQENIWTQADTTLPLRRTEVLCRKCDAHLGHVFEDGPPPTGLRYCLNSAALRLVEFN